MLYRPFTMRPSGWNKELNKAKLQLLIRLYPPTTKLKYRWSINQFLATDISPILFLKAGARNGFQVPPWSQVAGMMILGIKRWVHLFMLFRSTNLGFSFVKCIFKHGLTLFEVEPLTLSSDTTCMLARGILCEVEIYVPVLMSVLRICLVGRGSYSWVMTFYPYIFAMELNAMCSLAETVDTIIEHHCTTITHSTTIITNAEAQIHSKS